MEHIHVRARTPHVSPAVVPNCLVLDASLSGSSALDLQKRVAMDRPGTPIIFIAGCIDVPTAVKSHEGRGCRGFHEAPL
jgi:FixJ family two-component response regulator